MLNLLIALMGDIFNTNKDLRRKNQIRSQAENWLGSGGTGRLEVAFIKINFRLIISFKFAIVIDAQNYFHCEGL